MPSTFAWLDYSARERRTMLQVVDLFREKGTVDELGFGTIRDAFADYFFPGTSTLHSRARYLLFIPWVYLRIEREGVRSADVDRRARAYQTQLVTALERGGEREGVIGIDAREKLLRPPAVVYWEGLRRLGIRVFQGSQERYHVSLDGFYADRQPVKDEDGELVQPGRTNWRPGLPSPRADLWDRTTFDLTLDESEFLRERILAAAPDSLFAFATRRAASSLRSASHLWELPGLDGAQPELQAAVEHARRFSLVTYGAILTYNLMLAEASGGAGFGKADMVDGYRTELARWADGRIRPELDQLRAWDRAALWDLVSDIGPTSSIPARRFSEAWIAQAIADPWSVADQPSIRALIRDRERRLKGGLARLFNPRALERWSGRSGLGEIDYRWPNARTVLVDVAAAMERPNGTATDA